MGRSGARFPHTTLPEKFEMWKLKNADLGMFHKVLQCNGQNFGIDMGSLRAASGWGGGGGGGGGGGDMGQHARLPHSFLPENSNLRI